MSSTVENEITKIEKNLKQEIDISNRWKIHILKTFKDEISEIEELEELPPVLKKWSWIYRSPKKVWEVINLLDFMYASPVFLMVNWTIIDTNIEDEEIIRKKESTLKKRYNRGLRHCFTCNLVRTIKIKPEEVGRGKRSVTIWISPFAKDKHIIKAKDFYLSLGGEHGRSSRRKKTRKEYEEAAERELKYRKIVKKKIKDKKTISDKNNLKDFPYECPDCREIYNKLYSLSEVCKVCFSEGKVRNLVKRQTS
jgi:hypothetical protein